MKTNILQVREDPITGENGLVLKGVSVSGAPMVACEGFLIAHDLLEHPNGLESIGSIGDEIEALGGVWYIRGQTGTLQKNKPSYYEPVYHLGSDLLTLYSYYQRTRCQGIKVPNTRTHHEDWAWDRIIEEGLTIIKKEQEYNESIDLDYLDDFLSEAKHLMRNGYNKTRQRFKNICAWTLFWDIAECVDDLINQWDLDSAIGTEFKLHYAMNNQHNPWWEEYYEFDY